MSDSEIVFILPGYLLITFFGGWVYTVFQPND